MAEGSLQREAGARKRRKSVYNKVQGAAATPSWKLNSNPVSPNNAQGTKTLKKNKPLAYNSTETANSTTKYPLKIRVRKLDRATSLFGDTGKSYYGQVASQPKCKHIIMTVRGNAKPLDVAASNKVPNPCRTNSNIPLNKQAASHNFIAILPLSSQSRHQSSVHSQFAAGSRPPVHNVVLPTVEGAVKTGARKEVKRVLSERAKWSVIKPVRCRAEEWRARGKSKDK